MARLRKINPQPWYADGCHSPESGIVTNAVSWSLHWTNGVLPMQARPRGPPSVTTAQSQGKAPTSGAATLENGMAEANPYLNARREWDERYGDALARAKT